VAVRARVVFDSWLVRGAFGSLVLIALVVIAVGLVSAFAGPVEVRVATTFAINVSIVLGFQVFTGNTGIVSFGHVAFVGIGAYVLGLLMVSPPLKANLALPAVVAEREVSFLPAMLIAVLVTAILAFLIGIPISRLARTAAPIGTLAVLVIVQEVLQNWVSVTRGNQTFYGLPPVTTLWSATVWACVAIAIARLFRESPLGLRLRASQEDDLAAAAAGVDVRRLRLIAWTVSAPLCAIGGGLTAAYLTAYSPKAFYFTLTFNIIAMLIIGGMRSVSGAVIGAALLTVVLELLRHVEEGLTVAGLFRIPEIFGLAQIGVALTFILVMIFRRSGIMGRWEIDEIIPRIRVARAASRASV
jgi:branched-chain amino acid transport system permease protein